MAKGPVTVATLVLSLANSDRTLYTCAEGTASTAVFC